MFSSSAAGAPPFLRAKRNLNLLFLRRHLVFEFCPRSRVPGSAAPPFFISDPRISPWAYQT